MSYLPWLCATFMTLPVLPLGMLARSRKTLGLSAMALKIFLVGISSLAFCLAAIGFGGNAWSSLLIATWLGLNLAGALAGSHFLSAFGKHLVQESGSGLPGEVNRSFKARARLVWQLRIAGILAALTDLIVLLRSGSHSPLALAMFAVPVFGIGLICKEVWERKASLSERIHAHELDRFTAWVDRNDVINAVHVPDARAETMAKLAKLMAWMKANDMKAALVCRGRKTFSAVHEKWSHSWLVRSTHDLDHYAIAPISRCFHLPVGTNGSHIVSLRKVTQVLVDLDGEIDGDRDLRKEMRMFDEIWTAGKVSTEILENAAGYGITVKAIGESGSDPVILPSLPAGPVNIYGIVFPDPSDEDEITSYFTDIIPMIDRLSDTEIRLLIAFEGGKPGRVGTVIATALREAFGSSSVDIAVNPIDLINRAPNLIDGPWVGSLDMARIRRNILSIDQSKNTRNSEA